MEAGPVDQTEERLTEWAGRKVAKSTRRQYMQAVEKGVEAGVLNLPPSAEDVGRFTLWAIENYARPDRHLRALKWWCRNRDWPWPRKHGKLEAAVMAKVKESKREARTTKERSSRARPRVPLQWSDITTYLEAHPDDGSAKWAARAAMLTTGFRSLARGGGLVDLATCEVEMEKSEMVILKRFHKRSTAGMKTVRIPIVAVPGEEFCPVAMMKTWLERRSEVVRQERPGSELLFQWKTRKGWRPMTTDDVKKGVQEVARFTRGSAKGFGAHSLRRGGARALAAAGHSKEKIMRIGGWANIASMMRYWDDDDDGAETSRSMLQ